ncbi:hypothetical protein [Actinokineospora sp. HUAS TT18]|uniref:hypothetical protein n=1 Tax=Actinokineospora sp. HUAS TT18 TaxID=3447451 RepID=UPI003F51F826
MITIVLLNRNGGSQQTAPSTSSSAPPTTTSTSPRTTAPKPGRIDNAQARLTYQVPDDWRTSDRTVEVLGVRFGGMAAYGPYQCGNNPYTRSFAVGAATRSKSDKPLDPGQTAATFAKAFGERFHAGAEIAAPTSKPGEDGAVVVTVKITAEGECAARAAEVTVLAVPLSDKEVALLVVTSDLEGGPDEPPALDAKVARQIVESAATLPSR